MSEKTYHTSIIYYTHLYTQHLLWFVAFSFRRNSSTFLSHVPFLFVFGRSVHGRHEYSFPTLVWEWTGYTWHWASDKTKSTRSNAHVWIMRRFGHFLLRLVRHGDFDHPAKGYQRVDFPCYFQNFEACPKWTKSSRSALFLFTWHEPSHLPVWLHWTQILMPSHTLNNYPIRWKARRLFDHLFSYLIYPIE